MKPLLEIKNLTKHFPVTGGFWGKSIGSVKAVSQVSLKVGRGEILGLVGESGCGKSTLGRTILKLIEPDSGNIIFDDQDITHLTSDQMRPFRKKMQIVFQDPYASLNPRMTIGNAIGEPLKIHNICRRSEVKDQVIEFLEMVGLNSEHYSKYPHEFSGGQRQRVGIARAIAVKPQLIIADEPVSALDVSIQAQIINLLSELQEKLGMAMIFIAHDLKVVEHISERIAVMYLGKIMEEIEAANLEKAQHPYTKSLLSAIPIPDPTYNKQRQILKGDVPSPINPPSGCVFHTRCPIAIDQCQKQTPVLKGKSPLHQIACDLV